MIFIWPVLVPTLLGASAFTIIGYLLSRILKRNDIADTLWGLGFVGIAIIHASLGEPLSFRGKFVFTLTLLWGLRLGAHIGFRFITKKGEDPRYVEWRKTWGKSEPLMAFFNVFLVQGVIMAVISLPFVLVLRMPDVPLSSWDFLGMLVFFTGFIFEATADAQLMIFKRKPENHGKIMCGGVWSFCRHPNYFGEILIWWGLFIIAAQVHFGLIALASPLMITFLLVKVTGAPMLDKGMASKGNDFKNYVKNTPSFLPFHRREFLSFLAIAFALCLLDFIWITLIMGNFYLSEGAFVMRIVNGHWNVIPWPSLGVYFWLALGIQYFAVTETKLQTIFQGSLFGICAYSVYELTNLALVKDWPMKMALVDIAWGGILCGIAAVFGSAPKAKRVLHR
jgi:steroid 5-alpha reductase family enzyme/uncharacterized membrane protein